MGTVGRRKECGGIGSIQKGGATEGSEGEMGYRLLGWVCIPGGARLVAGPLGVGSIAELLRAGKD